MRTSLPLAASADRGCHSLRALAVQVVILLACLCTAAGTTVLAAPLALVTDLQGKASIRLAGRVTDATILSEIDTDAQLQLPAGTVLTALLLAGGDEFVFRGPAQVVFRDAAPEMLSGAKPEKRSPALAKSVRIRPVGLVQAAVTMRSLGAMGRIRLTQLDATQTVERSPTFRWQGPLEGLSYQIELSDDTGRMLDQATVSGTSYPWPAAVVLREGAAYRWTVTALLPGGRTTSTVGSFRVASDSLRTQAQQMRPDAAEPVSEHVAYAVWLDQVELKDAARVVWRALAEARPDDSRLKALAR